MIRQHHTDNPEALNELEDKLVTILGLAIIFYNLYQTGESQQDGQMNIRHVKSTRKEKGSLKKLATELCHSHASPEGIWSISLPVISLQQHYASYATRI